MCASVRERPASRKCSDSGVGALESLARPIALPFSNTQLWLFSLNIDVAHFNRCVQLLSLEESTRAARFKRAQDKNRYIAGRAMLRVLLARYLAVSPQQLDIAVNPFGKPILIGESIPISFNISHAEDCALVAISSEYEVGVDIESSTRKVDHDALAQRFFSAREQVELQRVPEAERRSAFLACWTRKEAVAKALGQGLRMPLETIEVSVATDAPPRLVIVPSLDLSHWTLHSVNAGSGFVATLALRRPPT